MPRQLRSRRGVPNFLLAVVLTVPCAGMVAACHALRDSRDPTPEISTDGLSEVRHRTRYREYVSPDAGLGAYEKILIRPVRVSYTRGGELEAIAAKDYDRLDRQLRAAISEALGRSYAIVDEAGADVLHLETAILGLSLEPRGHSRASIFVTNQNVTMVAELRDSKTRKLLYRAEQPRRIAESPLLLMDAVEFWSELERFFELWAASLVEILDHATRRHAAVRIEKG